MCGQGKHVEIALHACRAPRMENRLLWGAAGCLLHPCLCSHRAGGGAAAPCAAAAAAVVLLRCSPKHEWSVVSCRERG